MGYKQKIAILINLGYFKHFNFIIEFLLDLIITFLVSVVIGSFTNLIEINLIPYFIATIIISTSKTIIKYIYGFYLFESTIKYRALNLLPVQLLVFYLLKYIPGFIYTTFYAFLLLYLLHNILSKLFTFIYYKIVGRMFILSITNNNDLDNVDFGEDNNE